ncbi:MAG: GNAT family N-acetyltransferase [Cyanobacteria bacterium SZAS TMP-1]|nr:GNAT family N-acetyltransferase [Cyanobacteria bacterium SZAS TMP-1]
MPLKLLTSTEARETLHETRTIWSAGLKIDEYYDYNEMQQLDPWGRRNLALYGFETGDGQIAASLKLYRLTMTARGRDFPFFGVGAIFSRNKFRGRGFGGKIVQAVVEKARIENQAGLLLFSDIGLAFYEQYGFRDVGSVEVSVTVDADRIKRDTLAAVDYDVCPLYTSDLEMLERHHRRWLRRRPFGVRRSLDYFAYKVRKENYLHKYSRLPWPMLHVITVKGQSHTDMAYAIYEIGGASLRVLELVSAPALVEDIWKAIFQEALRNECNRIKSWESNILDFAPGYSLKSFLVSTIYKTDFAPTIYYSRRNWGKAMILPLDNKVSPWLRSFPSPILELDHL